MTTRRAVCPGSFDPVTNGHLDVFSRAAALADEVVVAVMKNQSKSGMFSVDERLEILREVVAPYGNIRVDTFEGRVSDIKARYTVIRSPAGRESIVPNEILITSRVENLSLADPKVWLSTVVSVAYGSDVELVRRLLTEAAAAQPRVLKDPGPSAALSAFGADGLEFTVGFWIADPENGQLNIRSEINLAILRSLREHRIEIPYPQRVVHMIPPSH